MGHALHSADMDSDLMRFILSAYTLYTLYLCHSGGIDIVVIWHDTYLNGSRVVLYIEIFPT